MFSVGFHTSHSRSSGPSACPRLLRSHAPGQNLSNPEILSLSSHPATAAITPVPQVHQLHSACHAKPDVTTCFTKCASIKNEPFFFVLPSCSNFELFFQLLNSSVWFPFSSVLFPPSAFCSTLAFFVNQRNVKWVGVPL